MTEPKLVIPEPENPIPETKSKPISPGLATLQFPVANQAGEELLFQLQIIGESQGRIQDLMSPNAAFIHGAFCGCVHAILAVTKFMEHKIQVAKGGI